MLVHYPLNLLRIITFPKHSKGLVSRKSRAISPPKCICHIQKGYTSQMSNRQESACGSSSFYFFPMARAGLLSKACKTDHSERKSAPGATI